MFHFRSPDTSFTRHDSRKRFRSPETHQWARSGEHGAEWNAIDGFMGNNLLPASRERGECGGCESEIRCRASFVESGFARRDVVRDVRLHLRQGKLREHPDDAQASERAFTQVSSATTS